MKSCQLDGVLYFYYYKDTLSLLFTFFSLSPVFGFYSSLSPPLSRMNMYRLSLLCSAIILSNLITLIFPLTTATEQQQQQHRNKTLTGDPEHAHFIIVGAGTSGSTLTYRLCELLPDARVTLLERSKPRSPQSELHVRAARNVFDAWADVNISSHLLTKASHDDSKPLLAVTGNTLGGTSAINAGQFSMPPNGTFSSAYGISGLSDDKALSILHQKVLPRIKPVGVKDSMTSEWLKGAERIGMTVTERPLFNDAPSNDAAFTSVASFSSNGRRRDAASAYDARSVCGDRLNVVQGAVVESLLFSERETGGQKVVNGVRLSDGRVMYARYEVVVTAGPYESPKLLQLSGIGPLEVLRRSGVKVKHELPVGTYGIARAATAVLSTYTGEVADNNAAALHTAERLEESRRYFLDGYPVGRHAGSVASGGILSHRIGGGNGRLKGLGEITMVTGFPLSPNFPGERLFNKNVIRSTCVLDPSEGVYSPLSIVSDVPSVAPAVHFNALQSERERGRMVQCVQRLRALHANMDNVETEVLPGEHELHKYVSDSSQNGQHYVGGCAVGKVVDRTSFRVIGLHGVSVVDASVIPRMPDGAGPMASVYVIAEHAAQVISKRFRSQNGNNERHPYWR